MKKPYVIYVGIHPSIVGSIDFVNYDVSVIAHTYLIEKFNTSIKEKFVGIGVLDVPHNVNLEEYINAMPEIERLVNELVQKHSTPNAFVSLYEHTVIPAAILREKYNLPGITVETATLCRDKVKMKEMLVGSDIKHPKYLTISSYTDRHEISKFLSSISSDKVVLKPRCQAASQGVKIFDSQQSFWRYYQTLGIPDNYELEEYINGELCHFDGIFRNGELLFFSASKYLNNFYNFCYLREPFGGITINNNKLFEKAKSLTLKVIKLVKLKDGVFHLEAFINNKEDLIFLEVACRFGGTGIAPMFKAIYQVDLVKEQTLADLQLPSKINKYIDVSQFNHASAWLSIPPKTDKLCEVVVMNGLQGLPKSIVAYEGCQIRDKLNEELGPFSLIGWFAVKGKSSFAVEEDCNNIIENYQVEVRIDGSVAN